MIGNYTDLCQSFCLSFICLCLQALIKVFYCVCFINRGKVGRHFVCFVDVSFLPPPNRYVDRLAESLQAKLAVCDKLAASQEAVKQRKVDTATEQQKLGPQLALMAERARELQGHIEKDISNRYKNRPVNIVGVNLSTYVA